MLTFSLLEQSEGLLCCSLSFHPILGLSSIVREVNFFFFTQPRFSILFVMRQNWYQARIFCICVFNLEEKSWKINGNNIFLQAIQY